MALRIAILNCSPPGMSLFTKGGKGYTASELLSMDLGKRAGVEPRIFWPARDPVDFPAQDEFDALIIPGSRLDIDAQGREENPWMEDLIAFIKKTQGSKPMLGVCFGHQAIAVAFGSRIGSIPAPKTLELGLVRLTLTKDGEKDPLFSGVPREFDAMMYHYRFIEPEPDGSVVLARGGGMVQSFRIGESTWGVQFHPDYSAANIRERITQQKGRLSKETDMDSVRLAGRRYDRLVLDNFIKLALRG